MRLFRPSVLAGWIYPEAVFRMDTNRKELCLTFDDGPDAETTPLVLGILDDYGVKAVFFCIGQQALKYPLLVDLIHSKGHVIGNHGFSHLNGWKTPVSEYTDDIIKAAGSTSSHLLRPPFGALRPAQYHMLKSDFRIIFWDLMPYDFDKGMGAKGSLKVLKKKIRPGSIIVLHDKASSAVLSLLGEFLDFAKEEGYNFIIPDNFRQ